VNPAPNALMLDIAGDLPMLRLDPVLTEHALVNVLENAVKYSPPDGQIRLSARKAAGKVVLDVEDEGPGIPEADREAVFEKFRRLRSGDRLPAGTGLGLSIARGFVEAQGGRMYAAASGRGARFVIEFPVQADAPVV
jgi:two-component system sensor histidine kinase KdpD